MLPLLTIWLIAAPESISPNAALKLVLVFLAAFALFAIARRASSQSASDGRQFPPRPSGIPGLNAGPARLAEPGIAASTGAPNRFGGLIEPDLGPVGIANLNFATFDADPGPADPEVFADELFVELSNGDTGYKWTQSYFIASPKGLERLLADKNWDSVFAHDVFVFRRYNLGEIRRTILEHIAEEQKLVSSGGREKDQS